MVKLHVERGQVDRADTNASCQWGGMLMTAAVIALLSPLTFCLDSFRQVVFCFPAARLSAAFLGAPCVVVTEGYLIQRTALPVLVSLACSGTGFFVLLTAMLLGLFVRDGRLCAPRALGVLVAGYGIALAANVCRITLGYYVSVWARLYLPECLWGGIHLSVGVLVFLSALVGVYVFVERRWSHE